MGVNAKMPDLAAIRARWLNGAWQDRTALEGAQEIVALCDALDAKAAPLAASYTGPDLAAIRAPVTPVARDLFLELLAKQEAKGITKYGESLTTNNGRDGLQDALEELVDLFQYLVQARLENAAQAERLARAVEELDALKCAHSETLEQQFEVSADLAAAREHLADSQAERERVGTLLSQARAEAEAQRTRAERAIRVIRHVDNDHQTMYNYCCDSAGDHNVADYVKAELAALAAPPEQGGAA